MKTININCLGVKITLLAIAVFLSFSDGYSQVDSTTTQVKREDTTRIALGKKEIVIIHGLSKTDAQVRIKDREDNKDEKTSWKSGGFKGHWSGIELGLNNYLNKDYSIGPKSSDEYMSLNSSRSIQFNLNFVQHSFGIAGNRFGMVTGMGLEFFNYFFRHNNTIETDAQGVIFPRYFDPIDLEKSKLTMTYLTVPILFEFQFPGELSNSHRLRISVGVIGGLKLGSHTKVVYQVNGDKKKDKNHDDFSINPFRYGFTARVGYKHINIYSDFYPVPLFEKGKGPVLYPFSVGIAFVGL
jgi:hypothetical protein